MYIELCLYVYQMCIYVFELCVYMQMNANLYCLAFWMCMYTCIVIYIYIYCGINRIHFPTQRPRLECPTPSGRKSSCFPDPHQESLIFCIRLSALRKCRWLGKGERCLSGSHEEVQGVNTAWTTRTQDCHKKHQGLITCWTLEFCFKDGFSCRIHHAKHRHPSDIS